LTLVKSDIVVDDITEEEFNDASDFDECEYSVDSPSCAFRRFTICLPM
jgi:hypothetical protein